MSFSEHRIPTADGLTLFLRDYAPHGGGSAAPVLCIPGLTRNSADFEMVAQRMAGLGRRVLAVDLRGRGHSDNDPDPTRYRPDIYAADMVYVLETLDIPSAVFVGTSLGGLVTMLVAAMAPDRIVAAVLNDIGPVVDPAGIARIAAYVGKSGAFDSWNALTHAVRAAQSLAFPAADDAFWKTMAHRVGRERRDGKIEFAYDPVIAQTFAPQPDAPPPPSLLPLFRALAAKPVLSVRGALSDILSVEGLAVMKEAKPDLGTVEVPRVGHAPTLDEPEAWAAIAAFLAKAP
jgi:pimeloyl-ACP methyl ester carboxylesterase